MTTATTMSRDSKTAAPSASPAADAQQSRAHQVVCVGKGGVDQLKSITAVKAQPAPNQVRVRVEFAGVCFADTLARSGMYPQIPPYPYVPGYECAGVVDAVGSAVTAFSPGDRVVAYLPNFGAYSEFVLVRPEELAPIPPKVSTQQAAALVVNYLTAQVLLHRMGNAKAGERMLVTSAAGGVGTAVLDLGRLAGLEMYGTASGSKHRIVTERGAVAIDYQNSDFEAEVRKKAPEGIDLFVDNVGGATLAKGYRLLRKGGRLVSNGALSIRGTSRNDFLPVMFAVYSRRLIPDGKKSAFNMGIPPIIAKDSTWYGQQMREILGFVAQGKITPLISSVIPLAQAAQAHSLLESGKAQGKILLDCR